MQVGVLFLFLPVVAAVSAAGPMVAAVSAGRTMPNVDDLVVVAGTRAVTVVAAVAGRIDSVGPTKFRGVAATIEATTTVAPAMATIVDRRMAARAEKTPSH